MGGEPAADLLSMVQTALRETLRTVNGQFISKAPDTEQYYLDLKKDIDYDAQIDRRAATLDNDALDRAYFSAIKRLMERSDESSYVTGHQIWQYQVEWQGKRVERSGYLFFGAPNDRPTAQPERDFYIYFIQPFAPPRFRDESKGDEVFFRLKGLDEDIKRHLAFYAAALDLASVASGGAKAVYQSKADDALRAMSKWLQEKQMTAFEVTYQGQLKPLQDWVKGISMRERARLGAEERINFRDVVNVVSGLVLNPHFLDQAPEYPTFSALITETNRKQMVTNALKALAGGTRGKDATVILDALEMLDGDRIDATRSKYAREVLARLKAKGPGQVLNRGELLSGPSEVEYFSPGKFRLEPDLLVSVMAGLVYSGDIVLAITGDKIDSGKLGLFVERPLDDIKSFRHLEAPKEINGAILRNLFELLGLNPGLAQLATQGQDEPVKALQESVSALVRRLLSATTDMPGRLSFWGQPLLREEELKQWRGRLDSLKSFTESLAPYNTVGKLKNLRVTNEDIEGQKPNLATLAEVDSLSELVMDLGSMASYLSHAETILPTDHEWVAKVQAGRKEVLEKLAIDRSGEHAAGLRQKLQLLKREYVAAYIASHTKARLGVSEDRAKNGLRKDQRLISLRALAGISLMPTSQLAAYDDKLDRLKSCAALIESDLAGSPFCPHCSYRPANEQRELLPAANVLASMDDELDRLLSGWKQTLLDNLDDPIIQANLELLTPADRQLVKSFVASKILPDPTTPAFVGAIQEALSGLEKITVSGDDIRHALLMGGSPATPDDLRKRFEALINERCRGKDASRLRFVVE
jgi:hypothetical protein